MKNLIIKTGCVLLTLGLSFSANAQRASIIDDAIEGSTSRGSGMTTQRDTLRMTTYQTRLRNSDQDQWKYIVDLKETFENSISSVQQNQNFVQQLKDYCASDTDSYTCSNADLVISADSRMDSIIRDWQNAVLIIVEIEKSRDGSSDAPRFKQREEFNALMGDMDRLNERAKKDYNLASLELVEFQESNPLLFNGS